MEYDKLIDDVKYKIDNFSYDGTVYDDIYNKAAAQYAAAYKASADALSAKAEKNRHLAVGSNALESKSLAESLAMRGLAKSGESSMMKINSAISLNNALSAISAEELNARANLENEKLKLLAGLGKDIGLKKATAAEAEKNALYNRLSELEALQAKDEEWRTKLANEEARWKQELSASIEKWKAELASNEEKWRTQLASNDEKWQAELELKNAENAAAEEKWQAELAAKEDQWKAELDAQIEKWKTELALQSASAGTAGSSGGKVSSGAGGNSSAFTEAGNEGFEPSTSAKVAAEALVATITDGSLYIRGDKMKSEITQAMIDLVSGTDLTEEYVKNLLFVLEAHGYDKDFNIDLAMQDFMGESRDLYKQLLQEKTALYQEFGMSYSSAKENANEEASYSQLRTVMKNCAYKTTFEEAATMLGFSEDEIEAFYKKLEADGLSTYDSKKPASGNVKSTKYKAAAQ